MHAVDKISNLLEIENELGPPPGKTSALDDILNYFQMVILVNNGSHDIKLRITDELIFQIMNSKHAQDVTMRSVIYSLLSDEGSLKSQRVYY